MKKSISVIRGCWSMILFTVILIFCEIVYLDMLKYPWESNLCCTADLLMLMTNYRAYLIIGMLPSVVGTVFLLQEEKTMMILMKGNSRRRLFIKDWQKAVIWNICFCVIYFTVIIIYSVHSGKEWFNWNEYYSFYVGEYRIIPENVNFMIVLTVAFVRIFFKTVCLQIIILFGEWSSVGRLKGVVLAVITLAILQIITVTVPWLSIRTDGFQMWINSGRYEVLILDALLLGILGTVVCKKAINKEYL